MSSAVVAQTLKKKSSQGSAVDTGTLKRSATTQQRNNPPQDMVEEENSENQNLKQEAAKGKGKPKGKSRASSKPPVRRPAQKIKETMSTKVQESNNNRTSEPSDKIQTERGNGFKDSPTSPTGCTSQDISVEEVLNTTTDPLLDKSFATSISIGGQTQQSNGEMSDVSVQSNASDAEIMAKGLIPQCKFYGKVSGDKRRSLLRDVCITDDELICITDASNCCIKVFNMQGEHLRSIDHKLLKEPFGISALELDKIIVADRKGKDLKIFSVSTGKLIESVGHNLSEYPMKEPRGVAVNSNGEIVVSDAARRCVYIYPLQGAFCDIIWGEAGLKPLQFKNPAYVTVTPSDDIVVSDYFGNKIAVFCAVTHDLKFTYGNKPNDKKLRYPRGVTIDTSGNIIVADNYNGKVHSVSSEDGSFVRYIYGDKHGIHRPRSVACDKNGNFVVLESGGRIRILTLTEIPSSEEGSEEGEV